MTTVTPETETCDQCGPAVKARFVVALSLVDWRGRLLERNPNGR